MGAPGGRKKDPCWKQVQKLDGNRVKCTHCGHEFVGGASRIKSHLSGNKNGVKICTRIFQGATGSSNRIDKTTIASNNVEEGIHNLDNAFDLSQDMLDHSSNTLEKTSHDMKSETKQQHKKHQVGPFSVWGTVNAHESQLIEYVFDSSLNQREIIFSSSNGSYLNRSELTTLKPRSLLNSMVIDVFADYLTDIQKKNKKHLNWYLPLTFSTWAMSCDISSFKEFVQRHKIREKHMSQLEDCEKMFIPVHIDKNSRGHFFLCVLHLNNQDVEIWDSLPNFVNEEECNEITKKLLFALDNIFMDDTRGNGWRFMNFSVAKAKDAPIQANDYDCGIFVIKFMHQQSDDFKRNPALIKCRVWDGSESDELRLGVALKLLGSQINEQRDALYKQAAECCNEQGGEEDRYRLGIKRKGIDTCARVPENVPGGTSSSFDDFTKRVKSNVNLTDIEVNLDSSSSPSDLSKGNSKGFPLPASRELVEEPLKANTEQILEWLMDDDVSVIGVWGMGGVGKTALVTYLHNQLLKRDDGFDHVIWVTVSQDYSICRLQKAIAKSIDLDISDEVEEKRVAGRLLCAFKQAIRCVLILDDVWDHICLEQVGVPVSENGIKLILTTRSLDVCQSMNCRHIIKVKLLDDKKAAWHLFKRTLGEVEALPYNVAKIAWSVIEKCEGLPLAILTIARSMKGKEDIREWRNLLENLTSLDSRQTDLEKWVFPILKSSYDHLNKRNLQQCFLYCALYPKGRSIRRKDLIRNFVVEGLINGNQSLEAQCDEGHVILNKLKNNSLLEECDKDGKMYRLHGLFWVMAVSIGKANHGHMVKDGSLLTELWTHDQDYGEHLQKLSLVGEKLYGEYWEEVPDGTSPRCPLLSTLRLRGLLRLKLVPDDFFTNMPILKVLDLSYIGIKRLPESVAKLESLVALLLSGCRSLMYVPSFAKLRQLMWLNLSYTAITQVPLGLEMLIKLRMLDLRGTKGLKMSTASVIPKLTNLQSLALNCIPESMEVKAKYILGLKKLEAISAHLCDIQEFNDYVRSLHCRDQGLRSYLLTLGTKADQDTYLNMHNISNEEVVKGVKFVSLELENNPALLPRDIDRLEISGCHHWRCLCHALSFGKENFPQDLNLNSWTCEMSYCEIAECNKLEYLFCFTSCPFCSSLQLIGRLRLEGLDSLRAFCENNKVAAQVPSLTHKGPFSHLRILTISKCNRIKRLLTPELSAQLQNLESIWVICCDSIEEIFSVRNEGEVLQGNLESSFQGMNPPGEVDTINLPKLESLALTNLPELNTVCKGIMACSSLKEFTVIGCPKLKRNPQIHPPLKVTKFPNSLRL